MTASAGPLNEAVTERDFSQQVYDLARLCGWLVYRTPTWRRTGSTPGFPDLVMVRGGHLIFAELKAEKGKLSQAQRSWLWELHRHTRRTVMRQHHYDVHTWRPSNWDEIQAVLIR
jgi:hypothetical protein